MTPAEELRAAAAKLRHTAKAATPGPWRRPLDVRNKAVVVADLPEGEQGTHISGYDRHGNRDQVGVVRIPIWSDGKHMRKRGGRDLEWVALAHPGLAEPLAVWLRDAATVSRQHTEDAKYYSDHGLRWCLSCNDEECEGLAQVYNALAVARVINGGAS